MKRKDEVIMNFSEKLNRLMGQQGLTQKQISDMTGIGASSISQYCSGKVEPSAKRKKDIAIKLGVQENYFDAFMPDAEIQKDTAINLPVRLAAKLMHKSKEWIEQGLRDGVFPWGYAVKLTNWSYFISAVKFTEHTGIPVPLNAEAD